MSSLAGARVLGGRRDGSRGKHGHRRWMGTGSSVSSLRCRKVSMHVYRKRCMCVYARVCQSCLFVRLSVSVQEQVCMYPGTVQDAVGGWDRWR